MYVISFFNETETLYTTDLPSRLSKTQYILASSPGA